MKFVAVFFVAAVTPVAEAGQDFGSLVKQAWFLAVLAIAGVLVVSIVVVRLSFTRTHIFVLLFHLFFVFV